MKILIHNVQEEAFSKAAATIHARLVDRPDTVLGLATGGTMVRLYASLIALCKQSGTSVSGVTTFNLDEYVGLAPEHPASYHHYMRDKLFSKLDFDPLKTHLPRGDAPNPDDEARRYEDLIKSTGGIDLQLLGIGRNGHIGFNEPSSSLASRTRVKTLATGTLEANHQYFDSDDQIPNLALTMGVGTILDSHECLLVATGADKAEAVAKMVEGPVTASCPASVLQFHQRVTVVLDADAAAKLKMHAYYQHVHPTGAKNDR
jgi:glucosamine-6-phosphate deaminase